MMQTPHHFFLPDPFERNLDVFVKRPTKARCFTDWCRTVTICGRHFCGSCAVIRRKPLDDWRYRRWRGGRRCAYCSGCTGEVIPAYMRIPQAAGWRRKACRASRSVFVGRGMGANFPPDNPSPFGKGLKLAQRLCYQRDVPFLSGIPRLIFDRAALAFLLLHAHIIYACVDDCAICDTAHGPRQPD